VAVYCNGAANFLVISDCCSQILSVLFGGSGNQMGILRLVSSLAGAPMFWFSGPLTEFLGDDFVFVLSLLAYE
jgi:hypothetical protein